MNYKKLAHRVARRVLLAYEPEGDLERLIAFNLSRQFGITDATEDVFDQIKTDFRETLEDEDMEEDLSDSDVYPYLTQAMVGVLEDEGMID